MGLDDAEFPACCDEVGVEVFPVAWFLGEVFVVDDLCGEGFDIAYVVELEFAVEHVNGGW